MEEDEGGPNKNNLIRYAKFFTIFFHFIFSLTHLLVDTKPFYYNCEMLCLDFLCDDSLALFFYKSLQKLITYYIEIQKETISCVKYFVVLIVV